LKEQQQYEALLLRSDLEAALAEPPAVMEMEEAREAERHERARELGELSVFVQEILREEREERVRIDEELDVRQQQASEEVTHLMNVALADLRAEMQSLEREVADPDQSFLEGFVAKLVRPERDACNELAQSLEAERGGRIQDLENEREARIRESTELRAATKRLTDKVEAASTTRLLEAHVAGRIQDLENDQEARIRESTDLRAAMKRLTEKVEAASTTVREQPNEHGNIREEHESMRSWISSEIEYLRGHIGHRAESSESHDPSIDSLREELSSLRAHVDTLHDPSIDSLREELSSLRAHVDTLARREQTYERHVDTQDATLWPAVQRPYLINGYSGCRIWGIDTY
jgi:hypothetical protein